MGQESITILIEPKDYNRYRRDDSYKIGYEFNTKINFFDKDVEKELFLKPANQALIRYLNIINSNNQKHSRISNELSSIMNSFKYMFILVIMLSLATFGLYLTFCVFQVYTIKKFFKK